MQTLAKLKELYVSMGGNAENVRGELDVAKVLDLMKNVSSGRQEIFEIPVTATETGFATEVTPNQSTAAAQANKKPVLIIDIDGVSYTVEGKYNSREGVYCPDFGIIHYPASSSLVYTQWVYTATQLDDPFNINVISITE